MVKAKVQKAKAPPGLTLTFGDEKRNLSVDALRAALENALDMLQSYQSDFITVSTVVRWEIAKVRMQSPLAITFEPKIEGSHGKQRARRIVTACEDDMRVIERNGSLPKHFNEDALIAMQKLLAVAKKEEAPLSVGKDKRTRFALTERSTQHIEQIVSKVRTHSDHSTIDGILSTVTVRGGKGFAIYDVLTDKRIECNVSDEHFYKWQGLIEKRVAVTGRVLYRNNIPRFITVENIRSLPTLAEFPKDVAPINITDGMPSEDYVRKIRNA